MFYQRRGLERDDSTISLSQMRVLEILLLEDRDADGAAAEGQIRSAKLEARITRARDEKDFKEHIGRPTLDVILASDACCGCDGLRALGLAQQNAPTVPFILLSDSLDISNAINFLTAGATDFIIKQRISKLVPAVRRAVREAEQKAELLHAREKLSAQAELLDFANDSIILCDAAGTITYWNSGSQRIYGWAREEAVGQNVHALLRTKFEESPAHLEATIQTAAHWEGELEQVRRDGTQIFVASHWTARTASENSVRLLINTDITARRAAEDALRESEDRYRRFVEEAVTGNFLMHADGSLLNCNPAYLNIFGFSSTREARAVSFMALLRSRKDGADLLEQIRQHRTIERQELEMRHSSGEAVYLVARLVGSFGKQGELTHVQGYLFNDTKRKRLEQQLIQSQKMEGLGTLAGGIAHDFNNILAIILGYTSKLERWSSRPEIIPGAVQVIKEAVERGAALVQQLLTSARQTEARFSPLDLNALVRELDMMLRATFPKMVNFELRLQPDFPQVTADRSQIHQVLLNLCVNARDAMPQGGTITLETALVSGEELSGVFTGADANRYACIRVRDTGTGMTPEVRAHIFEPFFTTKERAKGTGLGLSVVYGVVNNHRGFVQVDSEPEKGTTFCIYLPLGLGQGQFSTVRGTATRRKAREPQTILLVEDEAMLRDLAVEILQGEGYRVIAAQDGMEGVELFKQHRDEVGLVVCDLGLPRLGGREAFLKMKEIRPSVRAIVASGYLEPAMRSEILKDGVIDTIQKPYDFNELIEKIRVVIGKAQSDDDHPQLF